MTFLMLCKKMCVPGRLLRTNFKYKIVHSFSNANIHSINSIKLEPISKTKFSFCIPKRHFYRLFRKSTKNELKIKDDVPDQYTLIYRSTMDRYLLYTQIFTTVTVAIAIVTTIIKHDFSDTRIDFSGWKSPPRQVENEIFVCMGAFIAIVAILQLMLSRLPIRIYNLSEQNKYIFIFYGNYPFTQRKLVCKVGDVVALPERGITPWRQSRYLIKDQQKLILMDQYFRRPADLHIMLGIQKNHDVNNVEK